MEIKIFCLLVIIAVAFFIYEIYRRYRLIRIGRTENRSDRPLERLKYFGNNVLFHKKIRRYPLFGISHALIMWGFIVLLFSSIDMVMIGLFHSRILWIGNNTGYLVIRDLFILLVLAGVLYCILRRLVMRPEWLNNNQRTFVILGLIPVIVLSELLFYAVQTKQGGTDLTEGTWLVIAAAHFFGNLTPHAAYLLAKFFWWIHFLAIFFFLLIIPYSKHLHLLFAALNTYWHTLEPKGALTPVQLARNEEKIYGAGKLEDFTWKQLLDAFSCVKCGRCNGSCPAYLSGEQLKPKRINGRLRKYMEKKDFLPLKLQNRHTALHGSQDKTGNMEMTQDSTLSTNKSGTKDMEKIDNEKMDRGKKHKDKKSKQNRIVGNIIEEEFLWSCTTCGACIEACPVSCEHTSKIIDIRRFIVSSAKEAVYQEFKQVFQGIKNQGNPWGVERKGNSAHTWAKEQGIPTLTEKPDAEYMYFVGCAPYSDKQAQKTAVSFAKILLYANVDFAILGEKEWCCGESARRLGNELLFQETAKRNIEVWQNLGVKKILTTCPHCFNTLQNEYCQFGGVYQVIPHSVFLADLLRKRRLKPKKRQNITATYHDPCYLGRYNGCYNEQREILKAIPGVRFVEMSRTKENSFCCGAGGGRFWIKNKEVNVITRNRVQEAQTTGANVICTACSFCKVELQAEIKRIDLNANINTFDIAELLEASL